VTNLYRSSAPHLKRRRAHLFLTPWIVREENWYVGANQQGRRDSERPICANNRVNRCILIELPLTRQMANRKSL